jgi:hypothetical protein
MPPTVFNFWRSTGSCGRELACVRILDPRQCRASRSAPPLCSNQHRSHVACSIVGSFLKRPRSKPGKPLQDSESRVLSGTTSPTSRQRPFKEMNAEAPLRHLKLVLQGETLQQCKIFLAHCCILTTSGHSHPLLKITTTFNNVRFQKKMRLVSLEIPEPGATGYQNLMRQNSKLTRSDATRSTLRPKCPITAEEIEAGKRVR